MCLSIAVSRLLTEVTSALPGVIRTFGYNSSHPSTATWTGAVGTDFKVGAATSDGLKQLLLSTAAPALVTRIGMGN